MDQTGTFDRLLLDAAEEILLLVDGETLTILAANNAARRQLGYTDEQLLGQPIGEFECALTDMFFWDEMAGKREVRDVESALRCADERVIDVAKSVRLVGDSPRLYALRAVPVGGSNRIEAELAAVGSRLRATLEATADGILLVDSEGAIINMNQRFSLMWNLPESLLINRDDAGVLRYMAAQRAGEGAALPEPEDDADGVETQYLADGRVFECRVHAAHSGEELIGRVYSYRDVTERFRTQRELIAARDEAHRASRAKGEFLAMMSHEIRTPMNGVLGIAELLAGTRLDDEQADYLRVIRSSGETLLAIINDILDYSKIEAGKLELESADFTLPDLLEELTALFRFRLREDGPRFECTVDGAVPVHLRGDPVRLRQILFNLVGNAFKFTERGAINVHIALAPGVDAGGTAARHKDQTKGPLLRFAVHDTGIGLTPEQAGRLFTSFEQADSSTTRKYGGTGLGLAICKRLVELMGGEISVNSRAGAGSEFWFTARFDLAAQAALPLHEPSAQPTRADPEARPLGVAHRVLLVEDNAVNRTVMIGMIKKLGGGVPKVATNGAEAVALATSETFDLVLMDTQMPVMDGLEATRRLRQQGFTAPIIGVSAGALEDERQAALNAGVDDYVLKPVNLAALAAAIARLVSPP
jgi:PAS domain S-box-containing protein